MRNIIRYKLLLNLIIAILIILICPSIVDSSIVKNRFSMDLMINEIVIEGIEEPKYFKIEDVLEKLPKEIIRMIYSNGIKIDTTENLGEISEYGRITSKYIHSEKKILIQEFYSNDIVLLHEIGHAFSYNKLPIIKVSDRLKFRNIYIKEKDIIFPDGGKLFFKNFNIKYEYLKVNSEEYFAQCFAMFFTGDLPKGTKTYIYFESLFN